MKKVIKIYIFILIGLILMLAVFQNTGEHVYDRVSDKHAVEYRLDYEQDDAGRFWAYYQIPDDAEGLYVAFPTYHFACKVLIEDETVYDLKVDENSWNHSTGLRVNFIGLEKKDSSKRMSIMMYSPYLGVEPQRAFYVGSEMAIYSYVAGQDIVRFVLAIIVFAVGVLLFLYSVLIVKLRNAEISMVHFSVFSMSLAIWAMTESAVLHLLPKWHVEIMVIDHYMLMVMPIAFILFIKNIYMKKSQKIWSYCIYMLGSIVTLRTVLQFIFHVDFKETLILTHAGIIVFAFVGIILTIREVLQKNLSRRLKLNLICVVVIMFSTAIELGCYYFADTRPAIGMVGFLIYVAVISYEFVKISREQMEEANKADTYQKMAYLDELTGVYSRTAFHKHMKECDKLMQTGCAKQDKKFVVFIFDLNDLKKCNDTFGHEYGDRYLVCAAEAISKVFCREGHCYRIGGDEFSAIVSYQSIEHIEKMLNELEKLVDKINADGFVVHVSIAAGYAVFDKELDENLEQTMSRADERMYKKKHEMKHEMKQG